MMMCRLFSFLSNSLSLPHSLRYNVARSICTPNSASADKSSCSCVSFLVFAHHDSHVNLHKHLAHHCHFVFNRMKHMHRAFAVKFETGTSGLVRRIALPLLREDKGKPPIIIDLLPERSPMSARYIADILKMQEQTGLDGCLECALTSREDLTGVFGVLHGAMVPLGKSPPMSNEQLSETEAEKDLSRWDVVWVPDSNGRATTEFWIIMDGDKRKTKRHDEIVWGRINDKLSRGRLGEIWKIDVFSEKPYHRDRKSKPATEMDEAIRHGGAHVYKWKLAENYDFSVTAAK